MEAIAGGAYKSYLSIEPCLVAFVIDGIAVEAKPKLGVDTSV